MGLYLFNQFLSIIKGSVVFIILTFVFLQPTLGCEMLKNGYSAKVTTITDGDSVVLENGSRVRLIGIQAPKLALGRENFKDWPLANEAKQALSSLILGKKVRLDFGSQTKDRHDRILAHLFLLNDDNSEIWVQKYMLEKGMARVYSFADNRFCLDELLKAEAKARANKIGIWAHDYYKIRSAQKVKTLLNLENHYELVEGRVLKAEKVGSRLYLNFGKNWKQDFTIVIEKYGLRIFDKANINPLDYENALIRVRGWIEIKDGPKIEVTHPEQIEVLAANES